MADCCSTPPAGDDSSRKALRRSLLNLNGGTKPLFSEVGTVGGNPTVGAEVAGPGSSCCGGGAAVSAATCCGGGKTTVSSCCGSDAGGAPDYLLWGSLVLFLGGIAVHFAMPSSPGWVHEFGHTCVELLSRSWWGLLFGIVAVAVIGRIPRELVAALLGRGGSVSGLFRAVFAGIALDLCNHGILMVGMGLYKRGASLGQTIAFLIASPWNSLSLTLILAALIGWKWMLLFILLSALVALVTGWLADRLVTAGKIPANPNAVDLPRDYRVLPALKQTAAGFKPGAANYRRLLAEGLVGSRMVLRWVFFGFVLTGLIRAFVPESSFGHHFGPTLMGMLLTLVATTLIEVCSEGSSPIAADLLTRAHAPGNAFVFLMTGAATDYTEILSLRQTTSSWKATLALPLISTPQVLLLGWLLNHFAGG